MSKLLRTVVSSMLVVSGVRVYTKVPSIEYSSLATSTKFSSIITVNSSSVKSLLEENVSVADPVPPLIATGCFELTSGGVILKSALLVVPCSI